MRALVEQSRFDFEGNALDVTISIGATMAEQGETPEDLLARADRLLYLSKKGGRNRVSAIPRNRSEENTPSF